MQSIVSIVSAHCSTEKSKQEQRLGYQPHSNPPLWVIGRNLQIQVEGERISTVSESDSPCCILDGLFKVPHVHIEGDIDQGEALTELINVQEQFFKENFVSSLMLLGCMIMGVHFERGVKAKKRMPLAMALGHPNTAKSTAIECALSVIGRANIPLGDTTYPRLIEELSSHALPLMWDDVSNFSQLEGISLMCYNRSGRKTMKKDEVLSTLPLLTVNPSELEKKKLSKEKAMRIFSRILVIPFKETVLDKSLMERMKVKESLELKMEESIKSSGVIIQLFDIYEDILNDPLADEVQSVLPAQFDTRTQDNYFLLVYTVCKLLSVLNLKERYFHEFGPWLVHEVLPVYKKLMMMEDEAANSSGGVTDPMQDLIIKVLEKGIVEPKKISEFFVPDIVPRGCCCGACFAFNVPQACKFVGQQGLATETRLRMWVQKSNIGCTGRRININVQGKVTCMTCCHLKKNMFPADLLGKLKEAIGNQKKRQLAHTVTEDDKDESSHLSVQTGDVDTGPTELIAKPAMVHAGNVNDDESGCLSIHTSDGPIAKTTMTDIFTLEDDHDHDESSCLSVQTVDELIQRDTDELENQSQMLAIDQVDLHGNWHYIREEEANDEPKRREREKHLKKGSKRWRGETHLLDDLHPGNLTGKRKRSNKK